MAIVVSALVLSVAGTGERQLANASDRFQALLGQACNQAELTGREIGVVVSADGYAFLRLDGDRWRMVSEDELRARRWPTGMRVDLGREGRPVALATTPQDTPQLVCFSSGEATPFALTLALGEVPVQYRLKGDDEGVVKVERIEASQ